VGQQARQQFFGYVVFLGVHCAYGQAGLRRRWIVRLHKILHTLLPSAWGGADEEFCRFLFLAIRFAGHQELHPEGPDLGRQHRDGGAA
ncbi:hypothetical protein, partial [Comamonas faecalis]|uniref:hypothetical protein n=1 Tax=Comamonas faecalis TaxID=1387849 RepID=UPI0031ED7FC0